MSSRTPEDLPNAFTSFRGQTRHGRAPLEACGTRGRLAGTGPIRGQSEDDTQPLELMPIRTARTTVEKMNPNRPPLGAGQIRVHGGRNEGRDIAARRIQQSQQLTHRSAPVGQARAILRRTIPP